MIVLYRSGRCMAAVVTLAMLAACGGGGGGGETAPTPPAAVAAPTITAQPSAARVMENETAAFRVTASGAGTLSYQWLLNGAEVAGATSDTFTVTNAGLAQSGSSYTVRVSNAGGSVTSLPATLTVSTGPGLVAPKAQRLSASPSGYLLGTRADGSIVAWGSGMVGGTGTPVAGTVARVVTGVSGGLAVAAQSERSLVVTSDGSLYGWGRNQDGALGVQLTDSPLLVANAVKIGQVASVAQALACDRATYALKTDGTVWLVPGRRDRFGTVEATRVSGLAGVVSLVIATDSGTTCDLMALDSAGRAWVVRAQQGDWDAAVQFRTWTATVTQDLAVPANTSQLACSAVVFDPNDGHCLALTPDGKLWSWGKNNAGQLGLGDTVDRTIATQFASSTTVKTLLAGSNYSYILTTDGAVYGWGGFASGFDDMLAGREGVMSGVPFASSNWVPGLLPRMSGVEVLVMPGRFPQFMAAMKADGSVWVWGSNYNGVFGDGTSGTQSGVPTRVLGIQLK
jgi:alpha-tubulin suppressor-like RCC1 family protein